MSNSSKHRPGDAKAQASYSARRADGRRSIIAAHLIHAFYGHWAANDPRGSGSTDFLAPKFAALGPIHHGRKPQHIQPSRDQLRAFHDEHAGLLNFPLIWIDDAIRIEIAAAIEETIAARRYTCYACAICRNHTHLVIRTHKDPAPVMWEQFAQSVRNRLRLRFPTTISPHHPVISARPYNVLLHTPDDVWTRVRYVEPNPAKDNLPAQRWPFVTPYDNWPLHNQR